MRRRWRKQHLNQPAEVNITAFMNLMVVLVPFLLITAVFSRITVLDMELPAQAADASQQKPEPPVLQLEVTVRSNSLAVGDRQRGLLKAVAVAEDGSELDELSVLLQDIKARYPQVSDITLLLEPDIAYERLVAVMDTVRVVPVEQQGDVRFAELFPNIAIGDAPVKGNKRGTT